MLETPLWKKALSFNPVDARNELRLSGLAVGTLMRCLTSPQLLPAWKDIRIYLLESVGVALVPKYLIKPTY